jgi:GTP-binding protein EngB required for normal cell division/tetratricopeptide (TPR) repeat protein
VSSLVESLSRIASRVEIVARGVEGERRSALAMLERGRPLDAREHARAILAVVPDSALGLALWADAAEAAWLDDEAMQALAELSKLVPWRADVWLRLGRVAMRIGAPGAREALERAATAPDEPWAARTALLELADLDLAWGDPARAEQWLDRIPRTMTSGKDEAALLRRGECALARGALDEAVDLSLSLSDRLGEVEDKPEREAERLPGRRALFFARVAWGQGVFSPVPPSGAPEPVLARQEALRRATQAYILETPGSRELMTAIVATTHDVKRLAELRDLVKGMGHADAASMMAAFALAEGRRDDARVALVRALAEDDPLAPDALGRLAVETRDAQALAAVLARRPELVPRALVPLVEADQALRAKDARRALDAIDRVSDPSARPWAASLAEAACALWLEKERAAWPEILEALLEGARQVGTAADLAQVEALSTELDKPISLAIVGEFNAGKSTFINALLGVDVAPTGVLPTTATLHRVAWAPDPFARVIVRGAPDRVVPHAALKETLATLTKEGHAVSRVQIYAPIERLRWVEIIDTPGFNAPDPEHAKAARGAFDDAHAVVWLLDATLPLKATEASVLRDVAAMGLPIMVVLNKLDRLAPGDDARVLAHTTEGLAELGIRPRVAPMLLSARLALKARTEPDAATSGETLERSRWSDVEARLGEVVVDDADRLREGAMRRRAARLASALAEGALASEARDNETARARAQRVEGLRRAAQRVLADEHELAEKALEAVGEARRALAADLRPITQITEGAREDEGVRAYVAARAAARLSEAVVRAVAKLVEVEPPPVAVAFASAALEAAALVLPAGAAWGPAEERAVVRGAVRAIGKAFGMTATEEVPAHAIARWAGRLTALSGALEAAVRRDVAAAAAPPSAVGVTPTSSAHR